MKKSVSMVLAAALIFALTACSFSKLSDSYSEEEVLSRAEDIVGMLNALDFNSVSEQVREDVKDQLSAEALDDALREIIKNAGTFEKFKTEVAYGQQSKSTGEDFAVAVLICGYENANHTYTISMDTNLEIVGLYMK